MKTSPSAIQRHKAITLLFLKHVQLSDRAPEETEAVCPKEELMEDLRDLGGIFVRIAHVFATRGDLLPPDCLEALAKVEAPAAGPEPVEDAATIERIVEDELGEKVSRAFSWFSPTPYAFASAGQVHRAVLHSGRTVSVKVQRPGVRERMVDDLQHIAEIASFLDGNRYQGKKGRFGRVIEHFRVNLIRELDYRREASNLAELGMRLNGYPRLQIPAVLDEFTSARVLTTDFLDGTCLRDLAGGAAKGGNREALADELLKSYLDQILVGGFFHAGPHPGNVWLTEDGSLAFSEVPLAMKTSPRIRGPLIHLLYGLCQGETLRAAEAAMRIGKVHGDEDFDHIGLVRDMTLLISRERSLLEGNQSIGARLLEVAQVCSRAGLQMPPEVAAIGWAMVDLCRAAAMLCPTFDVDESIRWHLGLLSKERDNAPIPFPTPLERVG